MFIKFTFLKSWHEEYRQIYIKIFRTIFAETVKE